jgi:Ca2+-binding EF-hand superfamily protein
MDRPASSLTMSILDLQGFKVFDQDAKGFITQDDLRQLTKDVEEHVPLDDLRDMIREADSDGDGRVSVDDFVRIMLQTNIFR